MNTAPNRKFKRGKLKYLSELVRESLLTPTLGAQHKPKPAGIGETAITWIGHSSFLLEFSDGIDSRRALIDPVFARFLLVLKRRRKPGLRLRDLPSIDLVLVTHAHMDHLNRPSLRAVARRNRGAVLVVPRGVEDLVRDLGFREVRAMEPWQQITLSGLEVTMTPARHWGARMFNDVHRGYGGYMLRAGAASVYHSGDTAYFPGFREIGARLRPEIALLPIGAYSPDSFRSVHTSPEDALRAFRDLGSRWMIPMHYGTFRLSREPMEEPPVRLMEAARSARLDDRVRVLEEGRTTLFPARQALASADSIKAALC